MNTLVAYFLNHLKNVRITNLFLITLALLSPYLIIKGIGGGEFNTYLGAAEQLKLGNSCYNIWLHYGNQNGTSQYGYSPLFAFLLIPFTYLPVWFAPLLFLIVDMAMLFAIFRLLMKWLGVNDASVKFKIVLLTTVFSLRLILHNFEMVQLNIFLLWLTMQCVQYISAEKKYWQGALLLAFGINFKILPIVFVPYFLCKSEYKAVALIAIFSILLLLLPALLLGYDFNVQLLKEWINIINPLNEKYNSAQNIESYRLHGLSALIASYFSKNDNGTFQILISPLSNEVVRAIINVTRLFLILLSIFFISNKHNKSTSASRYFAIEISYLLLITPLIFPQQNKWAFVYLIPAFAIIFLHLIMKGWKEKYVSISLLAIIFALTTLTTDGIIGKSLGYYAECLKLLTIGTLLIIPLLMLVKSNSKNLSHE